MEDIEWLVKMLEEKVEEKKLDYNQFMVLLWNNNTEIKYLFKEIDSSILNINRLISEQLLDIPSKLQAIKTQRIITEVIRNNPQKVIVIDNFEILFSPILKVKPIELFRELSRYKIIIVIWRYSYENNRLVYAVPEHIEYQEAQINKNEMIIN
ncbi:BREX-3 system P-loop-containing protein BrxF [Enterococcus faecalis]|uniref:BREX-3 system P-loop-containing protein BrxF n=1 Tax=Enterococcus faecalis TaxID=1351 RepID=UPI000CF1F292|nr:BREX-3 system P-loop-containing protein BrxF [Enterococcus faecalis]EGO7732739.1 BREX-3 system P-loop-containing protein BrxF [Enterococcus faecalis]EGO8086415.1 BREX-3 system P-loop-containing protein BrxF [Enterococcus faecalis]EGO8108412.1 BREX-3 system P-loop-containing protein BrxF [Enterococcus faecalis]EGO8112886.1 BREX-3 system P-loop-containing protein BrxF [Enterococcus faecalis]EGO8942217.1 BREX-3 system P-loop-containing protein BrxF [Enterococcus faecalis]